MAVYKSNKPTKDGKCWYFRTYRKDYDDNSIQYWSKCYMTKSEATKAEAEFKLLRDLPNHKNFGEVGYCFIDYCYKTKKESTAMAYEQVYNKYLLPYFKRFTMDKINVSVINQWKDKMLSNGFKTAYYNKIYATLKQLFDFAIKNVDLESNPVTMAGRFKFPDEEVKPDELKLKYITKEQFEEFIQNVDDEMYHTIFTLLFYTGLRRGELQALRVCDIDLNKKEIIVNKTLSVKTKNGYKITNTKNYLNRKVVMNKILYEELKNYIDKLKKYQNYKDTWFLFGGARFLPQTNMDRAKHLYFSRCTVPEITFHEFRHSHVSNCINAYISSGETDTAKFFIMMSNRMGHSIEVMQKTYMHLFPTIQNDIVDLLDNL